MKYPMLTMATPLGDIPHAWLAQIEPRIARSKEHQCWIWTGSHDTDGEPVINFTNALTGARNTRRAKRMVADMFYGAKRTNDVIHKCGNLSCLNPSHIKVVLSHWTQR